MGKLRYLIAVFSLALGAVVLIFALLQPERSLIGIVFGVLLILNGLIRLYLGAAG